VFAIQGLCLVVVARFSPVGKSRPELGKEKAGCAEPIKRDVGEGKRRTYTFLCLKGEGEHDRESRLN
jgi:hypothetical protein